MKGFEIRHIMYMSGSRTAMYPTFLKVLVQGNIPHTVSEANVSKLKMTRGLRSAILCTWVATGMRCWLGRITGSVPPHRNMNSVVTLFLFCIDISTIDNEGSPCTMVPHDKSHSSYIPMTRAVFSVSSDTMQHTSSLHVFSSFISNSASNHRTINLSSNSLNSTE
jgi:hypothetical protein